MLTNFSKANNQDNMYICKYDDDKIGFFQKYEYKIDKKKECGFLYYDTVEIYCGYDNNKIGIKITHDFDVFTDFWTDLGYEVDVDNYHLVTNCQIKEYKSIRDIRIMMFHQGLINDINNCILTSHELDKTVDFFNSFYNQNKTKTK